MQKDVNPEYVGYTYRRLLEPVSTGIYECNSRCKCSQTCLNRVVQNPLQLKLQVFKTSNRGWGIRCLNDIPQGAFICIYAGSLLTEQRANEGGMNDGDEYLAELDYIEIVEKMKEDYEEEAYKSDRDEEDDKKRSKEHKRMSEDEDEDEVTRKPFGRKSTSKYTEDGDFVPSSLVVGSDSDIRTRLRRRNVVEDKESESKKNEEKKKKEASEEKKKEPAPAFMEDETVTISDDGLYFFELMTLVFHKRGLLFKRLNSFCLNCLQFLSKNTRLKFYKNFILSLNLTNKHSHFNCAKAKKLTSILVLFVFRRKGNHKF